MSIFDFLKNKRNEDVVEVSTKKKIDAIFFENIVKEIYSYLKELGFKKKSNTFNKQTEIGIYQIINIQKGRYEKYTIKGLKKNLQGKFTINLGVLAKEIYDLDYPNDSKKSYNEYDCSFRIRLPELTMGYDFWWDISEETINASKDVIKGLESHGIPWLSSLETRENIYQNKDIIDKLSPRTLLDVAIITYQINKEKGKELMQEYYNTIEENNSHKQYVLNILEQLGIDLKTA